MTSPTTRGRGSSARALGLDFAIDGYVHVRPRLLVPELTAPGFWRGIHPGLSLRTYHDRGAEGMRWYVTDEAIGATGTAELWLEPFRDGTLTHLFLRCVCQPATRRARRRARRVTDGAERRLRGMLFEVKDRLEQRYPADEGTEHARDEGESAGTDGASRPPRTDHRSPEVCFGTPGGERGSHP